MDSQDRAETRQMIIDLLEPYHRDVMYQARLTNVSLNNIDGRLDKLNGSILRHEKIINENLPHTIALCPQANEIKTIRDDMVGRKAINKIVAISIGSTAGIMTIIFTLYKLFWEGRP